ncbi:MAG: 16S rRNA (cytosine(1402)-N(4))-methyltransferase [Candidatus Pacebacteria bacterium RIFOXYB1_FULL_39_46]|nr:MAG: 16S rRNA (cytosine(1402)-N(4))-methyltransferase [Candidatus Pacebacteria bacterium RIFOXYB1_FULL_39_46]OGJ38829.1 MAG: 16S rRNA (cytosine(1402)-N(4))-methyltransferase [Candidatus Pacebacteria bacterium RIFOXYA1_FULL_38_18]OGJ40652.1 MAG: 16S rRNA (cytosine(1402)-N(4))-methyltransferase [Candidatus Pacebacteria bacterium RIFOXYD1_FULL_39_27]OGJ40822.1 MAG: 16S rRNA (cytosine(1402)-N(4))-methyltransferase [Candidatus Pacebacteria bacterium RIFOXYC1_FULL_39_21]
MNNKTHQPVMLKEAIDALQVKAGRWYVDATFGRGGHSQAILDQGGRVVGLDFDEQTIDLARRRFSEALENNSLILVRENFDKLTQIIEQLKQEKVLSGQIWGILFDFGTSTDQLMAEDRGLSFEHRQAKLDMRLDNRLGVKASDLLKVLTVKQLTQIFEDLGGEEQAKKIAKAIVRVRENNPADLEVVGSLVALISANKSRRSGHLHPATKVFQALRIAVNDELDNIERVLPQALALVNPGGRIVTIAFHEGEDRPVKQIFAEWEEQEKGVRISKKPIQPTETEINQNPRSRSAKLRIFERKE